MRYCHADLWAYSSTNLSPSPAVVELCTDSGVIVSDTPVSWQLCLGPLEKQRAAWGVVRDP